MNRSLLAALLSLSLLPSAAWALQAKVGKAAPDFTLSDADGKDVSLSSFKGKTVALEWTNRECPYVKKHYGAGNMQRLQKDYTGKGVVWLTINSGAPGKQGHVDGAGAKKVVAADGAAPTKYLLDPTGRVGKLYGAKTTPHMYVVDAKGVLRYAGAIDSIPSADPDDIKTAKNYASSALDAVLAGNDVEEPSTRPYGCGVKYK